MNLSREHRLLLLCAQNEIPEDTLDKIKDILRLPLNWEEFLKSAFWHGVAPLAYRNLQVFQESHVIPQDVMDQLKTAYKANLVRNMYLYAELKRILEALREKSVEVIILKGAALAKTVYSDIGLRPMVDIDLLVKKEDFPHAEKIISGLGYLLHGDKHQEWYRKNHYHIDYIHPEKNILVELHWHIANKNHPFENHNLGTLDIEKWWERAKPIEFSGIKVSILCPEDLLFYLSIHFLKHRFRGNNGLFASKFALLQLCDIYQTLKYYGNEINWERLKIEAENIGMYNLVDFTLYLIEQIMVDVDEIFHYAQRDYKPKRFDKELVKLIQKRIFIMEDTLPVIPGNLIQSSGEDTFQKKIKRIFRDIFPNPEILSKRYSVPLSSKKLYLYYLIRPFSLLLKYRGLMFEIPRLKEEEILNRWIHSQDSTIKR